MEKSVVTTKISLEGSDNHATIIVETFFDGEKVSVANVIDGFYNRRQAVIECFEGRLTLQEVRSLWVAERERNTREAKAEAEKRRKD